MKILLSILSSLTISGSGIAPLASTAHQFAETNSKTVTIQSNDQQFGVDQTTEMKINNNSVDINPELFDYSYNIQSINASQFNISQFLEQYLTKHPDSELEDDLLNSLSLVNQSIQINFDLLETYESDIDLYQILTSSDFINGLNEMYNKGLLTYDDEYRVFNFGNEGVQVESNKNKHI